MPPSSPSVTTVPTNKSLRRSCSNMPGELGMPVSRLRCGPITATRGANGRAIPASRGVRLLLPSAGLCFLEVREVRCENPRHFELHRTSRSVGNREDGIQPSDADVVGEPNVDRALGKVLGVHTSSSQLVRYRRLRVG
jgi:hypothetical protein